MKFKDFNFRKKVGLYDLTVVSLLVLAFHSLFFTSLNGSFLNIFLAVFIISGLDALFDYYKKSKFVIPKSGVISGLILGGMMSSSTSFLVMILASLVAFFSKKLICYRNKPVFNPAGFAVMLTVFSKPFLYDAHNWWIASSPLLVFLLGFFVIYRFNRLELPFTFLASYYLWSVLFNPDLLYNFSLVWEPAILFFSFFMLPEPKTSPVKRKGRLVYGVLTGLFVSVGVGLSSHGTFLGLLLGNLTTIFINKFMI